MNDKIKKIFERAGFVVDIEERDIMLSQYTPLGEDWNMTFDTENFIDNFTDYVENFDYESEAEIFINIRGTHGVPNSIVDLLEDAKWKMKTLEKVLKKIREVK